MSNLSLMGVTPKMPVEVRITLGRQPPDRLGSGFPIAKDRFWIAGAFAESVTVQGDRGDRVQRYLPLAPGFARWNADPFLSVEQWDSRKTEQELARALSTLPAERRDRWRDDMEAHRRPRRILRGILVHRPFLTDERRGDGAAWLRFAAQEGRSPTLTLTPHPRRAPACSGDGSKARRWNPSATNVQGTKGAFEVRPCDGDKCPLRQPGTGPMGAVACQKVLTLVFQLRWPDGCWRCGAALPTCPECRGTGRADPLPCSLAEVELGGSYNHAADEVSGFFADVERQWNALGLPGEPDYYGLPFKLTLVRKTGEARAFWTVQCTPDFPPGLTVQEWAIRKAQQLHEGRRLMLSASIPLALPGEVEDPREAHRRTRIAPYEGTITTDLPAVGR